MRFKNTGFEELPLGTELVLEIQRDTSYVITGRVVGFYSFHAPHYKIADRIDDMIIQLDPSDSNIEELGWQWARPYGAGEYWDDIKDDYLIPCSDTNERYVYLDEVGSWDIIDKRPDKLRNDIRKELLK